MGELFDDERYNSSIIANSESRAPCTYLSYAITPTRKLLTPRCCSPPILRARESRRCSSTPRRWAPMQGRREVRAQLPGQLALVVVLGGDGTVLHTVHLLHDRQVPILPINFGRLGFLANADTDGVVPLVAEALAGDLRAERRSILSIEVVCEGEHDPYGEANGAGEGAVWDRPDVNAKPSAATPPSVRRPGETDRRPLDARPGSLRRQRPGALRRTAVLRPERGGHHPRCHGTHHRADPECLGGGRGPHARRRPRRLHGHRLDGLRALGRRPFGLPRLQGHDRRAARSPYPAFPRRGHRCQRRYRGRLRRHRRVPRGDACSSTATSSPSTRPCGRYTCSARPSTSRSCAPTAPPSTSASARISSGSKEAFAG